MERGAYRFLSLKNAKKIGAGLTGAVYETGPDTVVKVKYLPDAERELIREQELSGIAFRLGIPTAIPFDLVETEEGYGAVYSLVDAATFAETLGKRPDSFLRLIDLSVGLLRSIHEKDGSALPLPSAKKTFSRAVAFSEPYLPHSAYEKLSLLYRAIPDGQRLLHGDFHFKNILFQNGKPVLIDMDTLSKGDPVFEFTSIYKSYVGYGELEEENVTRYFRLPYETTKAIYRETLSQYLSGKPSRFVEEADRKIRLLSYVRLIRTWATERTYSDKKKEAFLTDTVEKLLSLLSSVDSLTL